MYLGVSKKAYKVKQAEAKASMTTLANVESNRS